MKRIPVALVLLAVTVGLCVGPHWFLERSTTRMARELHRASEAHTAGDDDTVIAAINAFCDAFYEANDLLPLFYPHEKMDAIEESAALLPLLAEKKAAHLAEELARCEYRVQHLKDSERLTLTNLF